MKRKNVFTFLLAVCAVLCAFGLVACNNNNNDNPPPSHTHTYSNKWSYDENSHWHEATCDDTDEVKDKGAHVFNDEDVCTVCGYKIAGIEYKLAEGEESYIVSSADKEITVATILSVYKEKPVTAIKENAFKGCTALTSVTIPSSIVSIGNYAFQNCSALTEVEVPDSVTKIGSLAFNGCASLTKITVPFIGRSLEEESGRTLKEIFDTLYGSDGIPDSLKTIVITKDTVIPSNAFSAFGKVENIIVPSTVTSIGASAFEGTDIKSFVIGDNVTKVGQEAFSGCSLLTSITIGESVQTIYDNAFESCESLETVNYNAVSMDCLKSRYEVAPLFDGTALKEINFGEKVEKLPALLLSDTKVTEVTLPEKVEEIQSLFMSCTLLTKVNLPSNLKVIGTSSFSGCSALKSIAIPNSVTEIGEEAFKNSGLTNVTLPDSVISIGKEAFSGCTAITELTIGENVEHLSSDSFKDCSINKFTFNATNAQGANIGLDEHLKTVVLGDNVTRIPSGFFENCTELTSITLPSSLEIIGNYAFYGCSSLTNVQFPSGLKQIGELAFSSCENFTEITVPSGVESIGKCAFSGCSKLEEISLPILDGEYTDGGFVSIFVDLGWNSANSAEGIKKIKEQMPSTLKKVTISGGDIIGRYSFCRCENIEDIEIKPGITTIQEGAFRYCTSLKNIIIPDSVTYLYDTTLDGCAALESVTVNDSVSNIELLFHGSVTENSDYVPESLKKVTVSGTRVADAMFKNCKNIETVIINDSVLSIGNRSFEGCTALKYNEDNGDKYLGNEANPHYALIKRSSSNKLYNDTKVIAYGAISGTNGCTEEGNVYYLGSESNPHFALIKAKDTNITSVTVNENTHVIYDEAFNGCKQLTSVTLNENLKSIEIGAFVNCEKLNSITLPDGLEYLGSSAFSGCNELKTLNVPSSVIRIENNALYGAPIETLTLPYLGNKINMPTRIGEVFTGAQVVLKTLTILGGDTIKKFDSCANLTTLNLPESIKVIEKGAFEDCPLLDTVQWDIIDCEIEDKIFNSNAPLTHFIFGDKVKKIPNHVLDGCAALTTVTIPSSVTAIGDYAFKDCAALTTVEIPDTITELGNVAFMNCSSLEEVTLSKNLTIIGEGTFANCNKIEEITLPQSLNEIRGHAFFGCTALTEITIPENVTAIYQCAFEGTSIKKVIFNAINCEAYYIGLQWGHHNYGCPNDTLVSNPNFATENIEEIIFGENVKSIPGYAFRGSKVTEITIPDSVTYIGPSAFAGLTNLKEIIIPDSVTEIRGYAFDGCTSLTKIVIPLNVKKMGSEVFANCTNLVIFCEAKEQDKLGADWNSYWAADCPVIWDCNNNEVDTDGNTYAIIGELQYKLKDGNATVIGYPELKSAEVKISSSVEYKGETYSVTAIGANSFVGCTLLTSLTVPASITQIADGAFAGCSNLASITVDSANTVFRSAGNCLIDIANKALVVGCKNSVIPSDGSVTQINSSAFYGCTSLTSIDVPEGITSIGYEAFYGCVNLTDMTLPNSLITMGEDSLYKCDKLNFNQYKNGLYLGNETNKYLLLVKTTDEYVKTFTAHPDTQIIGSKSIGYRYITINLYNKIKGIMSFAFIGSRNNVINYSGTETEWNAISKSAIWNANTDHMTINYNVDLSAELEGEVEGEGESTDGE